MKRILGLVLAVSVFALGCEDITGGGGGGGGTTTTFTKGFVFVRDDKNLYAVDSSDYAAAPMQLTTTGNNKHPSISADGKSVVFVNTAGSTTTIQRVSIATGQTPTTVFTSDATNKNFKNPVFSPDGTKIAFNLEKGSVTHIGLVNADGSNFALLTPITSSYGAPAFYPDGDAVIAASGSTTSSLNSIQKVSLTGQTAPVRASLGNEATAVANRIVLSPDGTIAAFDGRTASGGTRIFSMPIAGGVGGNVTQLTDHPGEQTADDSFPTFVSSNELAFSSNFGGADQVYTVNPNATTKTGGTLTVPRSAEPWYGPN